MRRPLIPVLVCLSICVADSRAVAQERSGPIEAKVAAVNVLLGGVTAGVFEAAHRRPFWPAFGKGAIGGATILGGKCLISRNKPVTDWLGRGTIALGSSMVANASEGRRLFHRTVLPIGPIRVYRNDSTRRVNLKLDVSQTIVATYFATRPRSHMDWKRTFRHGGLFVHDSVSVTVESAGVIRNWQDNPGKVLVHEQIHAGQTEFLSTVFDEPLERYLLSRVPGGNVVHRYFDLGILLPVWAAANAIIDHEDRPWESDASAFKGGCLRGVRN